MRVDSIVIASGIATFTVGRGCLDTVPQAHAAYSYVMAWPGYTGTDAVDYTDAEAVTARILPRTPQGRLPIGSASDETVTFDSRAFRPLPVGNLKMDGVFLPSGIQSGTVTLTWAHRDRLTQTTTSIADHADGNIGPEEGVEYFLVKRLIDQTSGGGEAVSHTEEIPLSPPQVLTVDVDLDDAGFSVYAGADTIAMELGILTKRDSPPYENWQTPFIRFETAFAQGGGSSVSSSGGGGGISSPAELFGGTFSDGWWPTNGDTNRWQDAAATTPAVAGDPVYVIENAGGGAGSLLASSDANRPTLNANGLLSGSTATQNLRVNGMTTRSADTTFFAVIETTDTTFYVCAANGSSGVYFGRVADGDSSTVVSAFINGTITYWANGVQIVSPTRDSLHTAYATGSKVIVEVRGLDFTTSAFWGGPMPFGRSTASEFMSGFKGDYVLIGGLDEAGCDQVREFLAARHSITL